MAKTYITRPIVIEAIQYDGNNAEEICNFCKDAFVEDGKLMIADIGDRAISIQRNAYVVCNSGKFVVVEKNEFEYGYQEIDDRQCVCACSIY